MSADSPRPRRLRDVRHVLEAVLASPAARRSGRTSRSRSHRRRAPRTAGPAPRSRGGVRERLAGSRSRHRSASSPGRGTPGTGSRPRHGASARTESRAPPAMGAIGGRESRSKHICGTSGSKATATGGTEPRAATRRVSAWRTRDKSRGNPTVRPARETDPWIAGASVGQFVPSDSVGRGRRASLPRAASCLDRPSPGSRPDGSIGSPSRDLETIAVALDGRLDLDLRWRGATLDRLIDERHAAVVDATVRWLRSAGWDVAVEASFAIYAERGSIDVFGRHPDGALLVIEVKASIGDVNQTLIGIDRKTRLAPKIARLRGWPAGPVAALLVVAEGTTNRARITRHADAFRAALPASAQQCRAWVRRPDGPPPRGIVFVRSSTGLATGRAGPADRRMPTR